MLASLMLSSFLLFCSLSIKMLDLLNWKGEGFKWLAVGRSLLFSNLKAEVAFLYQAVPFVLIGEILVIK